MSFIAELKRRNVYRVAVMYVIAAWLIMQVVDVMFPALMLPDWAITLMAMLVIIGFPVSLILAWVFELTPEGIKLEKDVDHSESITAETGRNIDFIIIGLLVAAVIVLVATHDWSRFDEDVDQASMPSVAVLAFVDRSAEQDQAHFAEGLSETLIHVLAQIHGLKVIAKSSSFAFKGKDVDVRDIADQLGVATVLEGSIQTSGRRIRVIAQLVDVATGSPLWSGNFDREFEDIFAIQDEIAQEVVGALEVSLLDSEEDRLAHHYQPTLEAYGELVLGRLEMSKRTGESLAAAEQHFKKAIELDPNYSLAYVNLADAYNLQTTYSGLLFDDSLTLREPLIEKALELDPLSGEAHATRAMIRWDRLERDAAEEDLLRAIELSPNYAAAHQWFVGLLNRQDRYEEGRAHVLRAVELDPMAPIIQNNLAHSSWVMGRVEEALTYLRRNIEKNPEFPPNYHSMGRFLTSLGSLGEAQRWYVEARNRNPDQATTWHRMCMGRLLLGDLLGAEDCVEHLNREHPQKTIVSISLFMVQSYRGDWEQALSTREMLMEREPQYGYNARWLADLLARQGEVQRARQLMTEAFPHFLDEPVELVRYDLASALTFAGILHENGELERRDSLLRAIEFHIESMHRTRGLGYGVLDVYIHAMRGNRDQAIASLREAIDEGWLASVYPIAIFWWMLRDDWKLGSLRQDPEFIGLMNELENRVAAQRQWYEENKDKPLF